MIVVLAGLARSDATRFLTVGDASFHARWRAVASMQSVWRIRGVTHHFADRGCHLLFVLCFVCVCADATQKMCFSDSCRANW